MEKLPNIHQSWLVELQAEFKQPYMAELREFLKAELQTQSIYPDMKNVFNAFLHTPFQEVKVVIIGQDPYHGKGQAHGLSFSVQTGVKPPASLRNIYREISDDLKLPMSKVSGNLQSWASQGLLLLNAVLTVRAGKPASHHARGWEVFTDKVISLLNEKRENIVFMLWGNFAQQKAKCVDGSRHCILRAAHPSPYSVSGFQGCRHFSKANSYLLSHGKKAINWQIN